MKKNCLFITCVCLFSFNLSAQQIIDTTKIFGVTIDDPYTNIPAMQTSLSSHCVKPTARIVFDEWVAASTYVAPVTQIKTSAFIMGELLDSYYINQYSVSQYTARVSEYYNNLGNLVDIWEIGNEVNGDWTGNIDSVVAKIQSAYSIIKPTGKKMALTLYFNRDCFYNNPQNEMFTWVNNSLSNTIKQGLDYVLVSYYEDDCANVVLSQNEWQTVFDSLHTIFPNSKLGMGECGTTTTADKASYVNRYYNMNITTPGYIDGNFWWYYKQDCVPKTQALWDTLNTIICNKYTGFNDLKSSQNTLVKIYPNPTKDKITIETLQKSGAVSVSIYSISGPELINQEMKEQKIQIDISNLSSGIYFIMLISTKGVEVQKIIKE